MSAETAPASAYNRASGRNSVRLPGPQWPNTMPANGGFTSPPSGTTRKPETVPATGLG
jgi:hypothetical protein